MDILEREADVARLVAALDVAAADAGGTFVLVAGEAGIGKTTLVRLLRDAARGRALKLAIALAWKTALLGVRHDHGGVRAIRHRRRRRSRSGSAP